MSGPRYVCVHGHFYQPPRENPWLEVLERQKSAAPAHDWNERVTSECYAPNAHARILGERDVITGIVNNYARMSFNFGPTLLSWMETERPEIYRAILAADVESQARFSGHGSAMAQAYNHMILPLANSRDKVTQVRWGIRDFEHRFGRKPVGMWLAETAVDVASLEALAEQGIAFTVLAPHQCRRVRSPQGVVHDTKGQRVDPRRPYLARLPSGRTISLFFYDGPTSRAVAFERVLDDGHGFAARLATAFEDRAEPQLSHIATDGETYGHHHRYGEMALAVALERLASHARVKLTNYAEALARMPARWEAEIEENTSWSCAHGVERWRSDCGCNSGSGGHQKWRAPLRDALDQLRDTLAPRYDEAMRRLGLDPWIARDAYIDVVLDRGVEARDAFFAAHGSRALERAERSLALSLLEMQRHAMLMYTSCGWFFDEPSGLETIRILRYAARAMELASSCLGLVCEPLFLERLREAPSNRPEYGDAAEVFRAFVEPSRVDLPAVGAHFATRTVIDEAVHRPRLGQIDGEILESDVMRTGHARLSIGRLSVASRLTESQADLSYAVLHFGDHNLIGGIRHFSTAAAHVGMHGSLSQSFGRADLTEVMRQFERLFEGKTFSLRSLLHDEQSRVLDKLLEKRTTAVEGRYASIYDSVAPLMRFLESIGQSAPSGFRAAAEYTLMARLRAALSAGEAIDLDRVASHLAEAADADVALDPVALGTALETTLERTLEALAAAPLEPARTERAARLARFVADSDWKMELGEAQNTAWQLLQRPIETSGERPHEHREPERVRRALVAIGESLKLRVTRGG